MEEQDVNEKSFVYVEFKDRGSVIFNFNVSNVNPLQLLALAEYLKLMATADMMDVRNKTKNEEERKKIQVPEPKIMIAK